MLSERAFRAQLVTQGQRTLYDYWLRSAASRRMPARSDLDPASIPKLLPNISLVDATKGLGDAWFRLAGTQLHDIYGMELTGKRIDQVFAGASADYWSRIYRRLVDTAAPLSGVIRGPIADRDHVVLFWMRLPLSEDGSSVDRILCHDSAAPADVLQLMPIRLKPNPAPVHSDMRALPQRARYA